MSTQHLTLRDGDVLIAGAGLAGLFLALKLAPRRAVVLSPSPLGEKAASAWAQGGLAAALAPDDNPELHALDTITAGAGLVDPAVARLIARDGPARVLDLLNLGVPFDTSEDGTLALSLEAAHSRPRVARVKGDLAGKAIMQALIAAARASAHIEIHEGLSLNALMSSNTGDVVGALCTNDRGDSITIHARETVLAMGGAGGLYRVTTNPISSQGQALAACARIGITVADPEFVQFHPTAMDLDRDPAPLATEALRGEGAILVNADGRAFMADYHSDRDLAPRDIVARAIHSEIAAGRGAFLDTRKSVGAHFPEHFPTVFAACQEAGVDPRAQPIPVAPAAHYHMGGVMTDLWGRASAPGLSAIGECACTGAHGANRLASNSLLEATVFADRVAQRLRESDAPALQTGHAELAPATPQHAIQVLRTVMSRHVGVVRSDESLTRACDHIDATITEHGLSNPLIAARMIARAARARKESRGGHYREDFPELGAQALRTFVEGTVEE